MIRTLLLLLAIFGGVFHLPAQAADEFIQNNPDIKKYEFAKSYITALSYMKDIDDRWNKNAPKKLFAKDKLKMIQATLNDLALDDSDLRIIKNYLLKYMTSPNKLIRHVADLVVVACEREVAINDNEKELWQNWYNLNAANQATRPKEIEFVHSQHMMELKRKEQDKVIIQASVLLTKVLISDKNANAQGHRLAVTAQQRQKLLDKLDSYGADTLDWGLKAGQRTLEGSIAVIREELEDSLWISIDEK